jgi:hypothetical protein
MKKFNLMPLNINSIKKYHRTIALIFLASYINLMIGCTYYKVNNVDPLSNASIAEEVQHKEKYIILHERDTAWHIKDIILNEEGQEIKGNTEPLPSNHFFYKKAKKEHHAYKYKKRAGMVKPGHEIHIYTSGSLLTGPQSEVTIPFSSIDKIQVYDKHVGAMVLSITGVTVATVAVIGLIIAATKSSCPFVYLNDGESYNFIGEMYGGAIYPSLERDDYMPLPDFIPTNNKYSLRISNELLERQYTNLATLMVVEHLQNSKVLVDKYGEIQTITSPQSPVRAVSDASFDFKKHILSADSNVYLFDDNIADGKDVNSLVLSFKKPENAKSGKLILNAKNSFWLDYAYGKFNEQFGTYFNNFTEKQKKVPAQKLNQWSLDENIPLSVYVETETGWKLVDYFNTVGPLAARDMVMAIDLTNVKGKNVNVKLECGFMFWEVDYTAMDFAENIPVKVSNITPTSALDENGNEVSALIEAVDKNYLIQPEIGNVVTVEYPAYVPQVSHAQTVFLHSRGYYEYIRDYKNWPNIINLQSFRNKGGFLHFSKNQYNDFLNTKDLFAAALTQGNGD